MTRPLHPAPDPQTDAWRMLDDRDVQIDVFAGHWLVQTRENHFPAEFQEPEGADSVWWKKLDSHQKEPPQWISGEQLTEPIAACEHGIHYEIDFQSGYSQGIFLDQRLNRQEVRERVQKGDRVLNTFAYTCAFSVAAAMKGAVTTSVDLSRNYLEWGKRNLALNGIDPSEHYFTRGDSFDWLRRWAKSGVRFDGIILDPPTFSRNDKGKIFRVENDYPALVAAAAAVLNPGSWMLCCTNCRSLEPAQLEEMVADGLDEANADVASRETRFMPPEFDGDPYLQTVWVEL